MSKYYRHNFYEAAIDDVQISWEITAIDKEKQTDLPIRIHWTCIAYLGDNELHKMRTRGKTDIPETVRWLWAKTKEHERLTERTLFYTLFNWCKLDRNKVETKAKEQYVVFYCRVVEENLPEVQYETPENATEINWKYLKWLQDTHKHQEYVYVLWGCVGEDSPFAVYVGRTWNIFDRLCQHKKKPYWHFVQDIWFEGYEGNDDGFYGKTKTQADPIEYDLIQKLKPVFNKQVAGRAKIKAPARPFRHMKDMYGYLVSKSDQMHGDFVYNHIMKTEHMIETKSIL